MSMAFEPYVDAPEVAEHLGIKLNACRELTRRAGDPLPSYRFGSRRRYRLSEVDTWAQAQRHTGAAPRRPG